MYLLALLDPFTDPNDRFPHPFYILKPEKGTPFGRSLPVQAVTGSNPAGVVPSFIYPLQTSAHRLNTRAVKVNQVLLLVIKKVYFKSRGVGAATVYLV